MLGGECHRSSHKCHFKACFCQRFCECKTHLAGGVIADEAHGVNLLIGGTSGHQHTSARRSVFRRSASHVGSYRSLFLRKKGFQHFDYALRFFHTSLSHESRRQFAILRFDDVVSKLAKSLEIVVRGAMRKHVQIHGRCHKHRCFHGEIGGDEQVVCNAMRHLANRSRRSRCNDHSICPKTHVYMAVPRTISAIKELACHCFSTEGGEGEGSDELFGSRSHHHLHLCTRFDEQTHQRASLVGSDAPGDAEDDVLVVKRREHKDEESKWEEYGNIPHSTCVCVIVLPHEEAARSPSLGATHEHKRRCCGD